MTVHATGIIEETGKQFWSTRDLGQRPFTYRAGVGGVIKGWDQGCLGMKYGEARQLYIPPEDGYGNKGRATSPKRLRLNLGANFQTNASVGLPRLTSLGCTAWGNSDFHDRVS